LFLLSDLRDFLPVDNVGPVDVSIVPGGPVDVFQEGKLVSQLLSVIGFVDLDGLVGVKEGLLDSCAGNCEHLFNLGVGCDVVDPLLAVGNGLLDGGLLLVPGEEFGLGSQELGVASGRPPGIERVPHRLDEVGNLAVTLRGLEGTAAHNIVDVSCVELVKQRGRFPLRQIKALVLEHEGIEARLKLLTRVGNVRESGLDDVVSELLRLDLVDEPLHLLPVLGGVLLDGLGKSEGIGAAVEREAVAAVPVEEPGLEVRVGDTDLGDELRLVLRHGGGNLGGAVAGSDSLRLDFLELGLNLGEGHAGLLDGVAVVLRVLGLV